MSLKWLRTKTVLIFWLVRELRVTYALLDEFEALVVFLFNARQQSAGDGR